MPSVAPMASPEEKQVSQSELSESEISGSESDVTDSDTPVVKRDLIDQAMTGDIDIRLEISDEKSHSTYCFFGAVAAAFGSLCAAIMARAEVLLLGLPMKNALTAHFWLFLGMGASNWMLWKYYSKALEISDFWRATLTTVPIAMVLALVTGYTVLNDPLAMLPYCMGLCFTASIAQPAYDAVKSLKSWKEGRSKAKAE